MSFSTASVSGQSSSYGSQPPDPFSASGPFANLNLTSQQQSQIQSILSSARSQNLSPSQIKSEIDKILTPDQQKTLQSDAQKPQAQRAAKQSRIVVDRLDRLDERVVRRVLYLDRLGYDRRFERVAQYIGLSVSQRTRSGLRCEGHTRRPGCQLQMR